MTEYVILGATLQGQVLGKKVFYNKKRRLPKSFQIYSVWMLISVVLLPVLYFTGIETIDKKTVELINEQKTSPRMSSAARNAFNRIDRIRKSGTEDSGDRVFKVLESLKINNWQSRSLSVKENRFTCRHLIFLKQGSNSDLSLYLIPWNSDKGLKPLYAGLGFLSSVSGRETLNTQLLIFHDNFYNCQRNRNLVNRIEETVPARINTGVAVYYSDSTENRLGISGTGSLTSSIQFAGLFQNYTVPDFKAQATRSAFPFFQNQEGILLADDIRAVGLGVSDAYPGSSLTEDLIKLFTLSENSETSYDNGGFYISESESIAGWALVILTILLSVFIWFPLINRLGLLKENLSPVEAIWSTLFFSLVPLITFAYLQINDWFDIYSPLIIYTAPVLAVILYLLFQKMQRQLFNVRAGVSSVLILVILLMHVIAFFNMVLFIALIPVVFLLPHSRKIPVILTPFLLTLSFAGFLLIFYGGYTLHPEVNLFDPVFLANTRVFDAFTGLFSSFFLGSILALINRQ